MPLPTPTRMATSIGHMMDLAAKWTCLVFGETLTQRLKLFFDTSYSKMVVVVGGMGPWFHTNAEKAELYFQSILNTPTSRFVSLALIVCSVGYVILDALSRYKGTRWASSHPPSSKLVDIIKPFVLSDETLRKSMSLLRREIEKGLDPATKASSSVKCFNTYVQDLPTGKENGKFFALDLGGSNFRVLLVTLHERLFDMKSKTYSISEDLMTGPGEALFDYIANCLLETATAFNVVKERLPLGFTFSFPLAQVGLSAGILQRWTKGFNCPGVVNEDVVILLRNAIKRRSGLDVEIVAVLNDTTGTLMSCAWKNRDTKIGLILGTGTNACYVEKIEKVLGFDGDKTKPIVIINTEWGAFGDNGELDFLITEFDRDVDRRSVNPGKQIHEKLISGMYLGELVRVAMVKCIKEEALLSGCLTEEIQKEGAFLTEDISNIESDRWGSFPKARKVLKGLGYGSPSDEDLVGVRYICESVSGRAAVLASAGLATIINKIALSSLTIGVDGTLYRKHPLFKKVMVKKIAELVDPQIEEFTLMLSSDGSGRGAALVAASCANTQRRLTALRSSSS